MQKNKMLYITGIIALLAIVLIVVSCNQNSKNENSEYNTEIVELSAENNNETQPLSKKQLRKQQKANNKFTEELDKTQPHRPVDHNLNIKDKNAKNFKDLAKNNTSNTNSNTKSTKTSNIKPSNPMDEGMEKVIFGSQGGFTGGKTEYEIHFDGKVTKYNSLTKETETFKNLPKESIDRIFEMFYSLEINKHDFNEPGNMTYFVGYKSNVRFRTVYWGSAKFEVPRNFIEFQKEAKLLIRENNKN